MKAISVSTHIHAPADEVWAVLTDFVAYAEWNPFMTKISGHLALEKTLEVHILPPGSKAMTFRPKVTGLEPKRRIEWLGTMGVRGLFDGRHSLLLEQTDSGTVFTQSEEFSGLFVSLAGKLLEQTERGFNDMNNALRMRVESRTVPASSSTEK